MEWLPVLGNYVHWRLHTCRFCPIKILLSADFAHCLKCRSREALACCTLLSTAPGRSTTIFPATPLRLPATAGQQGRHIMGLSRPSHIWTKFQPLLPSSWSLPLHCQGLQSKTSVAVSLAEATSALDMCPVNHYPVHELSHCPPPPPSLILHRHPQLANFLLKQGAYLPAHLPSSWFQTNNSVCTNHRARWALDVITIVMARVHVCMFSSS